MPKEPKQDKAYDAVKSRLEPLVQEGVNVSPMRIGTREHGAEWSQKYVMVELADLERLFRDATQLKQLQLKRGASLPRPDLPHADPSRADLSRADLPRADIPRPDRSHVDRTGSGHFIAATILAGRLHVRGIPPWGPWDKARLEYRSEGEIEATLDDARGDRKIRTAEELSTVMKTHANSTLSPVIWIHESLEDEVRRVWEAPTKGQR
jgi:hypothetical protein